MRLDSGKSYRGRQFNIDLKILSSQHIDYDQKKVLSHSFRVGLATTMASLGYSEEEIMAIGRWRMELFLTYVKTARVKRCKVAREMAARFRAYNK